jgi:hypothetical protein
MSGQAKQPTLERGPRNKPVDLVTARRMLPLVQRIVSDILKDREDLNRFRSEQESLDKDKRNLSWPERQRRYTLQGEVARLQSRLAEEQQELAQLGAILITHPSSQVAFPTVVNGRPAYFSWQLGEESVSYWHFDGETDRRPIPATWNDGPQGRLTNQR